MANEVKADQDDRVSLVAVTPQAPWVHRFTVIPALPRGKWVGHLGALNFGVEDCSGEDENTKYVSGPKADCLSLWLDKLPTVFYDKHDLPCFAVATTVEAAREALGVAWVEWANGAAQRVRIAEAAYGQYTALLKHLSAPAPLQEGPAVFSFGGTGFFIEEASEGPSS